MQQKKGDKSFQKHNYSPDTQLFNISTIKAREISIKITFKNNKFIRWRILIVPEHKLLKILHQFHDINQIHIITLPCIAASLLKHCRLCLGSRKQQLDKTEQISWPPHNMLHQTRNHPISQNHRTTSHYKPSTKWWKNS